MQPQAPRLLPHLCTCSGLGLSLLSLAAHFVRQTRALLHGALEVLPTKTQHATGTGEAGYHAGLGCLGDVGVACGRDTDPLHFRLSGLLSSQLLL